MKTAAFVLALALAGAAPAFAQHAGHGSHSGHSGHAGHGAAASAQDSAATKAYKAANDKMHRDMDIAFTGDADADFLRGMIPHHQGAIDMAKIVLQHGKDPQVRKLAQEIVAAQEGEIAMMKKWLAERGK
ncbi:MAG: CopM family metallochaperone [Beijerinckiaceae bacterium]|jgi:uncharacterized protein (DUF305 family)